MKNLPFSSAFCVKSFDSLPVKPSLSSYLALALRGKILNSFRRHATCSVLASLALFSLSCLPASAQTSTASFCANEGGFCSFSGTKQVRYGANAKYATKTFANGIACNNDVFGDPIYGVAKTCEVLEAAASTTSSSGTGKGLKASYRKGTDAANSPIVLTRTDAKIDFNWGLNAPASSVPADQFSIKWEGEIQPRYTGEYTFYGTSDDGNVVIINGQTVVSDPNPHAARTASGKITLEAGKRYPITVFFFEATGYASMKLEWSSANQSREVVPSSQLYSTSVAQTSPPASQPAPEPTPAIQPAPTNGGSLTQAQFEAAIAFDFEGEIGKLQSNPSASSVGYPCGVPNNYSWKFGTGGLEDVAKGVTGRGQQLAGAGYNQVYNACSVRKSMANARIEFTDLVVDYYSSSLNKWVRAVKQPVGGAAFAEDFVNNQATGADIRDEAQGHKSVRSGIGNAASDAGGSTGRTVEDGAVGYNFHGFPDRFNINWADAKAVVASQSMRCIPHAGTDLSDCKKLGYVANVGLDSWASPTSNFDNFKTHGGVSGGRLKPVTTDWQIFTNYVGPRNFSGITAPPVPQF